VSHLRKIFFRITRFTIKNGTKRKQKARNTRTPVVPLLLTGIQALATFSKVKSADLTSVKLAVKV
jgi:hypothetical protein